MTATTIAWAPLIAPWVIIVLAILAAAAVGLAAWQRARGTVWRALAALAVLTVLANPTLVREDREALPDIALVVVDESASQEIDPRPEQSEAITRGLDEQLGRLRNIEVKTIRAGKSEGGPPIGGTRLFEDIERALGDIPRRRLAGIVLVSDGQAHDLPESLETLGIDAPIHLLLTGEEDEGDRRLMVGDVPGYGIVGREVTVTVKVEDLPPVEGQEIARLRLVRDGGESEMRRIRVGEEQQISFEINHRGPNILELEVEEGPNELSTINNRAAIEVNGVRDRLRVLLISGEPHAGERAWRHFLKSDPSVDLVHFTILRPPEKQDGTPIDELSLIAFPTRELFEEKINEFDLIIFDRYRQRGVLPQIYLDNVADYVNQGGALLEAAGPSFGTMASLFRTPLGRVLPGTPTGDMYEQGFRPRVTDVGQRHPVTANLPQSGANGVGPEWGRWFRQIDADSEAGEIVMMGVDDRPLLILDRVGEGRVAQLLSDHAWLWARGYEGGGPQPELMRRVAHWLMQEPELEEEDLQAEASGGRLNIIRRSLSEEVPDVDVRSPDGSTSTVELDSDENGRSTGSLPIDQVGLFEVSDGERTTLATVGDPNPKEFRDVRASGEALRPLVEASGGEIVKYARDGNPSLRKVHPERTRSGPGWIGLLDNRDYRVAGVAELPLLPAILALLLAAGALIAAWFREGQ